MHRVLLVTSCVVLTACASTPPPPPPQPAPKEACKPSTVSLAVSATDRSNFGADGNGRPVQLWVFLLKNDSKLQMAKFDDVLQNRQTALEGDIVKVDEYTVFPRETKPIPVQPNPDAHSLAAVALFREPQGKRWFVSFDLDAPRNTTAACPPPERRINLVLDRMQIGEGQAE
jgi:type VI secretion system protein VasD